MRHTHRGAQNVGRSFPTLLGPICGHLWWDLLDGSELISGVCVTMQSLKCIGWRSQTALSTTPLLRLLFPHTKASSVKRRVHELFTP